MKIIHTYKKCPKSVLPENIFNPLIPTLLSFLSILFDIWLNKINHRKFHVWIEGFSFQQYLHYAKEIYT